jgi:hypothetical protein
MIHLLSIRKPLGYFVVVRRLGGHEEEVRTGGERSNKQHAMNVRKAIRSVINCLSLHYTLAASLVLLAHHQKKKDE